jgi:hypothetical protein
MAAMSTMSTTADGTIIPIYVIAGALLGTYCAERTADRK